MFELSSACSWYEYRINVVPFGGFGTHGNGFPAEFVDDLETARDRKLKLLESGANSVMIYDTIDGVFYD